MNQSVLDIFCAIVIVLGGLFVIASAIAKVIDPFGPTGATTIMEIVVIFFVIGPSLAYFNFFREEPQNQESMSTSAQHYLNLSSLARLCRPKPEVYEFVIYDGTREMAEAIEETSSLSYVDEDGYLHTREWGFADGDNGVVVFKGDYLLRIDGCWILVRKNDFEREYNVIDRQ